MPILALRLLLGTELAQAALRLALITTIGGVVLLMLVTQAVVSVALISLTGVAPLPGAPGAPGGGPGLPPVPPGMPGRWDWIVPGGQGRTETGGTHGGHPAVDLFAPEGTPILAPVDGASQPAWVPLGGHSTILAGADGRFYYFAHGMSPFAGGVVRRGQVIGAVGRTGNARSTAPHLHLGVATNPSLFTAWNGSGDIDPETLIPVYGRAREAPS